VATLFTSASSQILARAGASITSYNGSDGFAVSALVKPAAIGVRQGVWGAGVSGSANNFFRLDITAGGNAQARARDGSGVSDSSSTGTLSAGTIYQMGYQGTSATSRQAVLEGVLATASTTSRIPAGINRTTVGGVPDSGTAAYMNGTIYYVAEWAKTLTQSQWDMLADRIHPLEVAPEYLLSVWLLNGRSTEIDIVGVCELTPTNSPTKADNDGFLRSYKPIYGWGMASAAPVGEDNTSELPVAAVTVEALAPTATTTERHISNVPVSAVTVAGLAPTATKTENRNSTLPVAAVTVAALAPTATTTEKHISNLPLATVAVAGLAPTATVATNHTVNIPVAAVTVAALAVTASTTEHHISALPLAAVTLQAYPVTAEATGVSDSTDTHDGHYHIPVPARPKRTKLIRRRKKILRKLRREVKEETKELISALEREDVTDIRAQLEGLQAELRELVLAETRRALALEEEAFLRDLERQEREKEEAAQREAERLALEAHYRGLREMLEGIRLEAERIHDLGIEDALQALLLALDEEDEYEFN